MYIFAVLIMFIFIFTSAWFMMREFMTAIASAGNTVATALGSDSSTYTAIDTFLTNIKTWLPIIGLVGVGLWSFVYAQRKRDVEMW